MKIIFFLCLSFVLPTEASAFAVCSCTSVTHDRTKSHIHFSLNEVPNLKFFDNRKMMGAPSILLNEKGAYVNNELVCSWPHESFMKEAEANRVLGFDGQNMSKPCPLGFPLESGYGDLGVGSGVLCLEVIQQTNEFVEVSFKGKSYYLDAKSLNAMQWEKEPGSNEPCTRPE